MHDKKPIVIKIAISWKDVNNSVTADENWNSHLIFTVHNVVAILTRLTDHDKPFSCIDTVNSVRKLSTFLKSPFEPEYRICGYACERWKRKNGENVDCEG